MKRMVLGLKKLGSQKNIKLEFMSLKKDFSKKTYHKKIVMLVSKTTDIEELAAYSKNLN